MREKRGEKKNRALIVFTREPVPGKTKTRLMPYFTPRQCADIHIGFLKDIYKEARRTGADIIVAYDGETNACLKKIFGRGREYIRQTGDDLGIRMDNALRYALDQGYEKAVLIGTDIPELTAASIRKAFDLLDDADVVLGPTADGGYHLIGMKEPHPEVFAVKAYGNSSVLQETLKAAEAGGSKAVCGDEYHDLDVREDAAGYRERMTKSKRLQRSHTGRFLRDNATVSVIVPVYNESSTICQMTAQLRPYMDDAEILFVDGGSTDDTVSRIDSGFTVLTGAKGRAAQMNLGAQKSSGDILLFLHCDSVLPPDMTGEVRRCLAKNAYGCFGVRFPSRNFFMLTNRVISNHRAWRRGLPFGDQGIFIPRELFFRNGMFPEIPIMEDYEFGIKLRAAGIRPGRTKRRITTSPRRYGSNTLSILKTEYLMWNLRRMYRRGTDIQEILRKYKDIR